MLSVPALSLLRNKQVGRLIQHSVSPNSFLTLSRNNASSCHYSAALCNPKFWIDLSAELVMLLQSPSQSKLQNLCYLVKPNEHTIRRITQRRVWTVWGIILDLMFHKFDNLSTSWSILDLYMIVICIKEVHSDIAIFTATGETSTVGIEC